MAETVLHAGHEERGRIDWPAGVYAGLIAGVVFLMLEMIMVWLFMGESPWAPPRMIAAMVLGEGVLPMPDKPATFGFGIMLTAVIIHFVLSIIYALLGAAIVANRMGYGAAIGLGALCGLVIYLINFYPIAAALFPWFAMARNWISIFAHIVFGALVGAAYVGLRKPAARA
jgi:uncharacterized membrane protein YagU involved in acid resistance